MATLAQLQAEAWWIREFTPPALSALRIKLLDYFNLPGANVGIKGNTVHLRGYHRSHAWIKNSRYCTNRTYSVSETPGNRNPGNDDWLSAIDITVDRPRLIEICRRLDVAVRAGRLEKVTEWYGNDDGDNRVDGFNNIANVVATSDSSHLWHLHISFDRGRVNEDHTDLYDILIGEDVPTVVEIWSANAGSSANPVRVIDRLNQAWVAASAAQAGVTALQAVVQQLADLIAAGGGSVDTAAILAGVDERLAAFKTEVEQVVDAELDEQSVAGADAD